MSGRLRLSLMVALLASGGCSSKGGGGDASGVKDGGLRCGNKTCAAGQICCIDCNGQATCGPPGTVCAGVACRSDGGVQGIPCANKSCLPGQVCCIDCNGQGSCGPPGTACVGVACGVRCGPTTCPLGQVCCDHCTGRCVNPASGMMCPDDNNPNRTCPDGGACGSKGARCCAGSPARCGADLTCCSGVPYPEGGICLDQCTAASDRHEKEQFAPVDGDDLLRRLAALPVTSWKYRGSPGRHVGPMAQDFHAAFRLGESDRRIDLVDANGVVVAAIQSLYRQMQALRDENRQLRRSLGHGRQCR